MRKKSIFDLKPKYEKRVKNLPLEQIYDEDGEVLQYVQTFLDKLVSDAKNLVTLGASRKKEKLVGSLEIQILCGEIDAMAAEFDFEGLQDFISAYTEEVYGVAAYQDDLERINLKNEEKNKNA